MEVYHLPILQAILIFPVVAFLFTIPYMLIQYHKYGSLPLLRVGVVYSFILYLIAAYFLVILPLPSKEEVLLYTSPTTQLVPFTFIQNIIVNTSESTCYLSTFISRTKLLSGNLQCFITSSFWSLSKVLFQLQF